MKKVMKEALDWIAAFVTIAAFYAVMFKIATIAYVG